MVKVSVVMPVYNAASTVESAIASVFGQGVEDIEILAVDDCSSDGSVETLERLSETEPRLRFIRRATNGGPSAARNDAIDRAAGEWIALLDADDVFLPGRLQRLLRIGEEESADLVADNMLLTDIDGGRSLGLAVSPRQWPVRQEVSATDLSLNDRPSAGGGRQFGYLKPIMRRAFLDEQKLRYRNDLSCGEDFDLYMRSILAGGRMILDPEAGYAYGISMKSLSFSPDKRIRNLVESDRSNSALLDEAAQRGARQAVAALKRRRADIAFTLARLQLAAGLRSRDLSMISKSALRIGLVPRELARYVSHKLRHRLDRRSDAAPTGAGAR